MMIKYLGKLQSKCESCGKIGNFMYKDDKSIMKSLFKEVDWEEQTICEPCAKKASGSKYWDKIKRK